VDFVIGAVLFSLAALLRAAHEALRSSSRIRLRHFVDERGVAASAELQLEHPAVLRAVVFSWESALAISGALLLAPDLFATGTPALVLALLLLAAVGVAAAGALIGSLARAAHTRVFPLLAPLSDLFVRIAMRLFPAHLRRFQAESTTDQSAVAEGREAMDNLLEDGLREGIGDREDMELVAGVIDLRDTPVQDVMIARSDIFALSADLPTSEIARRIAASGYSRVPICSGSLDSIAGIFHVLDVLKHGPHDLPPLRPIVTVDAQERCGNLLQRMLRQQAHICIVTDAAGRTVGLVTLEDLLEEIVGDIRDEFDEPVPAAAGHAHR
jgi:putative hemolysin